MLWLRTPHRIQALASTSWCVRYQLGTIFDGLHPLWFLPGICSIPAKPDDVASVLPRGHIAELHQIDDLILQDVSLVA
jgi:hypothetical protein